MVRAHARIRTLEEDNEILRMHVDLLTTDNKQLGQKVRKAEKEKTELLRISTTQLMQMRHQRSILSLCNSRWRGGKLGNNLANQRNKINLQTNWAKIVQRNLGVRQYKHSPSTSQRIIKKSTLEMRFKLSQKILQSNTKQIAITIQKVANFKPKAVIYCIGRPARKSRGVSSRISLVIWQQDPNQTKSTTNRNADCIGTSRNPSNSLVTVTIESNTSATKVMPSYQVNLGAQVSRKS